MTGPALPGKPRWILIALYTAAMTAAVVWPAWPGLMSSDSLTAYEEGRSGIQTMLWPPLHAYLFALSQDAGAEAWGLFVFQTAVLFGSAALAITLLVRSLAWVLAGLGAFALAFVAVPELLGVAMAHWHDTPTASFALAALALWLLGAGRRSLALVVAGVIALGLAVALRYNAVLLAILIAPMMVWRPFLAPGASRRARATVAVVLALSLGLAWASTVWRLPDLQRPAHPANFGGTQEFDLIGISACADRNYLPPGVTAGAPITPRQIRMAYDPRHLQLSLSPHPGVPRLLETDAQGDVERFWPIAIRREPGCYLAHRTEVFIEQMGLSRGEVFYPVHAGGIDPNPFGLALAHPRAFARVRDYIESRAPEPWRRPALLYLLAVAVTGVLWRRGSPARLVFLAALGGALAYAGALFIAAPAADARYIFPSNVVCALMIAAGLAALLEARAPSPAPRS